MVKYEIKRFSSDEIVVKHKGAYMLLTHKELDILFSIVPTIMYVSYRLDTKEWKHQLCVEGAV